MLDHVLETYIISEVWNKASLWDKGERGKSHILVGNKRYTRDTPHTHTTKVPPPPLFFPG